MKKAKDFVLPRWFGAIRIFRQTHGYEPNYCLIGFKDAGLLENIFPDWNTDSIVKKITKKKYGIIFKRV